MELEIQNQYNQEFYCPYISLKPYSYFNRRLNFIFRKEKKRIKRHIRMYVANILINDGKVAVSRSKQWFTEKITSDWHSFNSAIRAQDLLEELDYIIIKKGEKIKGYEKGICSILEATDKFYKQLTNMKILTEFDKYPVEVDPSQLFDVIIDNIKLKGSDEYNMKLSERNKSKLHCALESYFFKNSIRSMLRNTYKLNEEYFSKMNLGFSDNRKQKMIQNVKLTRIIKRDGCGRYYQQFGKSYLNIKKEDRQKLTINGVETMELDFKSIHINILCSIENKQNPYYDSYMEMVKLLVGREDKELRDVVKQSIIIAINAKSFREFSSTMFLKRYDDFMNLKRRNISLRDLFIAFEKVHPELKKYLTSDMGIELMLEESNIMENILLRLHEENISGLPLFDCVIYQKGNDNIVKEIMEEEYLKYTGFSIPAEIKA